MTVILAGGTGELGRVLRQWFVSRGTRCVVLSRRADADVGGAELAVWDGKSVGQWAQKLDGADVVVNLAGRSVNCRYTDQNRADMMNSRVDSTRAIGQAIERADQPPAHWLQMSTATIYAHRFDAPNDEATGIIGGDEPGVPDYWGFSVDIAKRWEQTQRQASTPDTRKVALRTAMVMSPTATGVFGTLCRLARRGLGGAIAGGDQYVSWIHERDFVQAIQFILDHSTLSGPINIAAPNPLIQRRQMKTLRQALGVSVGLPAAAWMVYIGAFFMRTDPELVLKSRRVIPGRLDEAGFDFQYPTWAGAVDDLVANMPR